MESMEKRLADKSFSRIPKPELNEKHWENTLISYFSSVCSKLPFFEIPIFQKQFKNKKRNNQARGFCEMLKQCLLKIQDYCQVLT